MIYKKLFPYQKKIVDKFKNKSRFGLFLDMGCGKTPISLALAEVNNCSKIIIVTLKPKVLESKDKEGSWLNWASYCETNPDILLINYESLYKHRTKEERQKQKTKITLKDTVINFLATCKNENVAFIIDESHKIKDLHSLQTCAIIQIKKVLDKISSKVFTYLLTGTPFTTGYEDLYSQLKLLGYDKNKSQFADDYCVRGQVRGLLEWQQPIVGYKNIDELFNEVHKYAITIKSNEVVDLPEQIFVNHALPESIEFEMLTSEKMTGKDICKYMAIRKGFEDEISNYNVNKKVNNPFYRNLAYPSLDWLAETTGSFWMRCRQISIGFQGNAESSQWYNKCRLDALKSFLRDNEDNYVLFYNYTPELLEIYDICDELGYNIDVYCGEIKSTLFYEKYEKQSEAERLTNKKNIIISNFASGSTGMNWQAYNKCIIFSIPLYKDYEQGIKRVHRLGQKQTVFYHIFYENNWLDEEMLKALQSATDYSQKMFSSDLCRVKNILEK